METTELPVWKKVVIGSIPIENTIERLEDLQVVVHNSFWEILANTEKISSPISVNLFKISSNDINYLLREYPDKSLKSLLEIMFESGYCLCPPEVALSLFIERKQKLLGSFSLAMRPVPCSSGNTLGTYKDSILQITDTKRLYGFSRNIGTTALGLNDPINTGSSYVFCQETPELISLGLDKF